MEGQAKKTPSHPDHTRYFCRKCRALAGEAKKFYKFSKKIDEPKIECPACGLTYIYTEDFSREQFGDYLATIGCSITIDDVDGHRARLSQWVESIETAADPGPRKVADLLEELVPHARAFIHLTLSRLTPAVFRMLEEIGKNVPVRVISTDADEDALKETGHMGGRPHLLEIRFAEGTGTTIPPDKILVVDGLVAVTGKTATGGEGANNLDESWENVVAETEKEKIISLNNRLFSPPWGATSEIGEKIFMDPA
jgi:hypothetical protein